MNADLHCHPLLHTLFKGYEDAWFDFDGINSHWDENNRFIPYMQCDMSTMAVGDVDIVIVALHPPEQKKFFAATNSDILKLLIEIVAGVTTGFTIKQFKKFQDKSYNHFQWLQHEMGVFIKNQHIKKEIRETGKKHSYIVAKNFTEVQDIVSFNKTSRSERKIAVIFSIEGLHALGRGHIGDANNPHNVSMEVLLSRIDRLKIQPYPTLFLTFTHIMDNSVCGQARALVKTFRKALKFSDEGVNKGLSDDAKILIERLLDNTQGRRILIDVKHMSLQSRLEYYAMIEGRNIPIVASHMGLTGKSYTTVPQVNGEYMPKDDDSESEKDGFNEWSINLYDEEIILILQSKGLIGLNIDQRILGGKQKMARKINFWSPNRWANYFFDSIRHAVQVVMKDSTLSDAEKRQIWDIICIGSDYDGLINPMDTFLTAHYFPSFKKEIGKILNESKNRELLLGFTSHEILEKIFHENIYNFLRRNFQFEDLNV
jgi:microsomal dipeptidase-like Zn-dependent dipeptidase